MFREGALHSVQGKARMRAQREEVRMDMLLLPGGVLRAMVWDTETRETVMRDVTEDLPFYLRTAVRLHDRVTLRDLLLLAESHREFLLPLFTDLLDEFVEEVQRPVEVDELCELDFLEICWESYSEGTRFDLQPVLVGRNHEDRQVYSVEAVPTNAMGHLPVLLRSDFQLKLGKTGEVAFPAKGGYLRRDFLLYDVFDAVLAEITFHGDPRERDRWWREIGSRELDRTEPPEEH
jgi:hypothetical protein